MSPEITCLLLIIIQYHCHQLWYGLEIVVAVCARVWCVIQCLYLGPAMKINGNIEYLLAYPRSPIDPHVKSITSVHALRST